MSSDDTSPRVRILLAYIQYLKSMDRILLELLTSPPQATREHTTRLIHACEELTEKAQIVVCDTKLYRADPRTIVGDFKQCAMLLLIYNTRISYIKWLALRLNNIPNMYYPMWLKTFKVAKIRPFDIIKTSHMTSLRTYRCYNQIYKDATYHLKTGVYGIIKNEMEELEMYIPVGDTDAIFTNVCGDDTEIECDSHNLALCGQVIPFEIFSVHIDISCVFMCSMVAASRALAHQLGSYIA